MRFKNWKSTMAFFIFIGVYIYSVSKPSTDSAISTAGYLALIMSFVMVLRNEITPKLIEKALDIFKGGKNV